MNEMIEKLQDKDYVRAFGRMSPEEQELFKKAGKKNCLYYGCDKRWAIPSGNTHNNDITYAIKSDYQPEPEFVDLEITMVGGWLGVKKDKRVVWPTEIAFSCKLGSLSSLPNFRCFWYDEQPAGMSTEDAATRMFEGHKVFAKLRTKQ